ncbi:MAG TPA: hypothetical protein VHE57_06760 [Mycobacteriales bacterium]|nr:hypothetical protein [Mycobacteriales bacterium]
MTKLRGLIVCAGAASLLALAAPATALGPVHHQTERATVHGAVTALAVRGEVGQIVVRPGAVTRIVATEQYNLEAPRLVHSLRHGVLRVSAPCPRTTGIVDLGLNDCAVDFVVTVPRSVTVDARDSVGNIRVRDIRGTERLSTDVGDIEVTVPAGTYAVHLHTDIGDTRVRGITQSADAARMLSARTDTGDIRITGR